MNPIVERVAKAIYQADYSEPYLELYPWESLDYDTTMDHYVRLAWAAIKALGLAEETLGIPWRESVS